MKWEMEIEDIEAVLEKIWYLHDKFSDAIHSISKTHFYKPFNSKGNQTHLLDHEFDNNGFVFVKDYDKESAIVEAKSLNAIRSALENLEDHLDFFHTIQIQQRAERDSALARLEQSRLILALRLAEHRGHRCKVIDEAMDFIGDVRDSSCFVRPENLSKTHTSANKEHSMSKNLVSVLMSGLDFLKRRLKLEKMGGAVGNAALFSLSLLTLLHLHQINGNHKVLEIGLRQDRSGLHVSSSNAQLSHLDVHLARG